MCGMIRESMGKECGDGLDRDKKQINQKARRKKFRVTEHGA